MKHVTLNSIQKAIEKVDNLDDDGLEKLAETYALAQDKLLGYIMTATFEYQNEKLEGLLIYYYCLISECFNQEGLNPKPISEDQIDAFQEPFYEMLDSFFESDDDELLESFCDQPELTKFMAMEVSTEDDDGSTLDDETATQLYIVAVAMIGLMSRAIED